MTIRSDRPPQQLESAVDISAATQPHQDPIGSGSSQIDPRVAAQLVAELAHNLAGEPDVRLVLMAMPDLDLSEPERRPMSAEFRLANGCVAQLCVAAHEIVGNNHPLSTPTTPH